MVFRIRKAVEQGRKSAAFWMVVAIAVVATLVNLGSSRGWMDSSASWAQEKLPSEEPGEKTHFREGTELVDLVGKFRIVGDRVHFIESSTNRRSFRCLENLALQRVYQAIRDDDREKSWIVQGKVTEYLNENFFLLARVVRSPQASASDAPR